MLLPLGAGLAVNAWFGSIAEKMRAPLNRISTLSLALLIVLLLVTNIQNVIALFGTRGILASILFLFGGAGIGWLLGGPGPGTKGVLRWLLHSAILPLRLWSLARTSTTRKYSS